MKVIIDEGLYNEQSAVMLPQFDTFAERLREFSLAEASKITSVPEESIVKLARLYASANKRVLAMTSGASENTKSLNTLLAAANLVLLMGDAPETLQVPAEFSNTLGMWMVGVRPLSAEGRNSYDMFYKTGTIKAMYIMGENPLVSFQDVDAGENFEGTRLSRSAGHLPHRYGKTRRCCAPGKQLGRKKDNFMSATGRVPKISKLISEAGQSIPDLIIFRNLARVMNRDLSIKDLNGIRASIADLVVAQQEGMNSTLHLQCRFLMKL